MCSYYLVAPSGFAGRLMTVPSGSTMVGSEAPGGEGETCGDRSTPASLARAITFSGTWIYIMSTFLD